jgi:hypothetical protein
MSMPQYIEIAVVGATEKRVLEMTDGASIPESGIAPRYHLVSISSSNGGRCQDFSKLNYERVLYWVALDDESLKLCTEASAQNSSRKGFSRGFYSQYLPSSVIKVHSNQQFIEETHRITEAFCATS